MTLWAPYFYLYGLGGAVFVGGLLLAWRRGALRGTRPSARVLVPLLIGGLLLYALGHAVLQAQGTGGSFAPSGHERGATGFVGSGADLAVVAVYFLFICGLGAWFARSTRTTSDFFFAGRRFGAGLIALSCVATTVGAYSFVKYASAGFRFGLSSTMSYTNDWFWMPLWMLVWLPIVYHGRIQSVPEYFQRRFSRPARNAATVILLVYLVGYIGINFLTLGKAIHALTGWPILAAAALAVAATSLYVAAGGQTSVIMTDLVQGLLLLAVGIGLFVVGAMHLGGFIDFWALLPGAYKAGLAPLRDPASFNTIGVFWQDALANGVAFYFINQGILMRFLSARSVNESRKAMAWVVLLIMPLAALAVSGLGWIARAMVVNGELGAGVEPDNVFVVVSALLSVPGVFGLIMAALTAALMSTADTLLTAVAAVFVNDIWRPYLAPKVDDQADLRVARWTTVLTAVLALGLVPLFARFDSIYLAHATFVAVVTPPMAVALLLGVCWPRFHDRAAVVTLVGGAIAVAASVLWPSLITPFAQGVEPGGEGLKAYKYMRACYGLVTCTGLGVLATYVLKPGAAYRLDLKLVAGPEDLLRRD